MIFQYIKRLSLVLFPSLVITFFIHTVLLHILGLPLLANGIVLSYIVNLLLCLTLFFVLIKGWRKNVSVLGYMFMLSGALKFVAYFIIFNPIYKADGIIKKVEFTTFFIPYAVCLLIEIIVLVKILNSTK